MSRAGKSDIFNEEETLESLFKSAKSLEIIPPGFSPEFFKKHFFYFFIERNFAADREDKSYNKFAFGKPYYQSMVEAFHFVFTNARLRPLDLEVVNQLIFDCSQQGY